MLTPQEVSERAFPKASFGGYTMSAVDDFLDVLTADYTALYNENAVLKSKMKVLVDKVEEYRSTEEAMRKALLTAQRIADEMVAEAEGKKKALLAQVELDAAARVEELKQSQADQVARLEAAKAATMEYVAGLKRELAKEVDFIARLESISAPSAVSDPVRSAAEEIAASMRAVAEAAERDAMASEADPTAATQVFQPIVEAPAAAPAAPVEEDDEEDDPMAAFVPFPGGTEGEEDGEEEAPADEVDEPTRRTRFDLNDLANHFGGDSEL